MSASPSSNRNKEEIAIRTRVRSMCSKRSTHGGQLSRTSRRDQKRSSDFSNVTSGSRCEPYSATLCLEAHSSPEDKSARGSSLPRRTGN
jgi:hypothetical protein